MEEKLVQRLHEVKDGYSDFYIAVPRALKRIDKGVEKMLAELERRPDMTTSDIIEYLNELEGLKKVI